eukprot:GHVU01045793.1.p1 GENE.GHVU01045793.1~~GHVU01045793.1.p1  ORF type:complete len:151 (-),score=8.19 GHVU01045793.1:26-478(-)
MTVGERRPHPGQRRPLQFAFPLTQVHVMASPVSLPLVAFLLGCTVTARAADIGLARRKPSEEAPSFSFLLKHFTQEWALLSTAGGRSPRQRCQRLLSASFVTEIHLELLNAPVLQKLRCSPTGTPRLANGFSLGVMPSARPASPDPQVLK